METVNFIKLFKDLKTTGGISNEEISSAERSLKLNFADEYKLILKGLGATRFNGKELNGLTKAPALNVIEETKNFRELTNIPNNLYVISSLGIDFVRIMQNEKGEIFTGSSSKVKKIADSIFDYLLLDIKNNISVGALMEFFKKLNIPNYQYSVGYAEEAFCIEKEDDIWVTYIGERGNKFQVKKFEEESEACLDFLIKNIDYAIRH